MSLLKELQAALNIAPEMAGGQNSDECVEPHAIIQNMIISNQINNQTGMYL